MTAQTVFNKVVRHLRQQGKKAAHWQVNQWGDRYYVCDYRSNTAEGLKCAVGCLISDSEYTPDMELKKVAALKDHDLLPKHLIPHLYLLKDLQKLHDEIKPSRWEQKFRVVAKEYNLTVPV